jgi:hypothetical protein
MKRSREGQPQPDGQQQAPPDHEQAPHDDQQPLPLRAALRGEFVHPTALRCAHIEGKGHGVVAAQAVPPGELLLRARGLRFSAASAGGGGDGGDSDGDGAAFLAEALGQLCELRAGSAADSADAAALVRGWRGLCPRPVPADARAPLDAQAALLVQMLAHFEDCGVGSVDELIELIVKVECNAFEGGLYPLAASFNHSCAANCSVALRQIQLEQQPGPVGEAAAAAWVYEVRSMAGGAGIAAGEELCLNYLGLAEQHLAGYARRAKLHGWGFDCACLRCAAAEGSPWRQREAELVAVRCPSCAQSRSSSRGGADGEEDRSDDDVWSDGWCRQVADDRVGPCLSCQRTPPQALGDRLAALAQRLRAGAAGAKAADLDAHEGGGGGDRGAEQQWGLRAAVAELREEIGIHPGHWLQFLIAEALAERSQAAALALRDAMATAGPPSDASGSKQKVEEEYRLAVSGHAAACRDCVTWAEAASCYAEYERGMARLLERYATALRAAAAAGCGGGGGGDGALHLLLPAAAAAAAATASGGDAQGSSLVSESACAACDSGGGSSGGAAARVLTAEASRLETRALDIMRTGYGGFDFYSE